MKIDIRAFALAVGSVAAAAFTVCAFFVAVAPAATGEFIGYLLHIDLTGLTRPLSWDSYLAGVLAVGSWTGLWAGAAAAMYNLSLRS